MKTNLLGILLIIILLQVISACNSGEGENRNVPPTQSPPSSPSTNANNSPTTGQSESLYSEINNQMTIAELRQRLEEVKAIEREARQMNRLRQRGYWEIGVAECTRIMERVKPRASAIRDEYKRMLSPAGLEIANAAMSLIGCIDCIEDHDDDCSDARKSINNAERELKKEEREATRK